MTRWQRCVTGILAILLVTGCAATPAQLLAQEESQLKLRSAQSRIFEMTDHTRALRAVIATLQDLGFVIDYADLTVGTVTGTQLVHYSPLKMTITIRPHDATHLMVRANALYGTHPINDPEPYQRFFAALRQSVFVHGVMDMSDEPRE